MTFWCCCGRGHLLPGCARCSLPGTLNFNVNPLNSYNAITNIYGLAGYWPSSLIFAGTLAALPAWFTGTWTPGASDLNKFYSPSDFSNNGTFYGGYVFGCGINAYGLSLVGSRGNHGKTLLAGWQMNFSGSVPSVITCPPFLTTQVQVSQNYPVVSPLGGPAQPPQFGWVST
jgi:hypothetical protein